MTETKEDGVVVGVEKGLVNPVHVKNERGCEIVHGMIGGLGVAGGVVGGIHGPEDADDGAIRVCRCASQHKEAWVPVWDERDGGVHGVDKEADECVHGLCRVRADGFCA